MEKEYTNKLRQAKSITYDKAFELNGKTPPQAVEIEKAVLGALMLDEFAIINTMDLLRTEFFYQTEHQCIFKAIHVLVEKAMPVDIVTVVEELRREGKLEDAGGAFYISQLTNNVVSSAHIEFHARILSEKFIQRELIRLSTETITKAYDETTDIVSLLDTTEQHLLNINDGNFRSDYQDISDIVKDVENIIEEAEKQKENGGIFGLASGFTELDQLTSGFQPGTLIILAARPAMGKTALALNIARNIAMNSQKAVAFFSLEMPATEIVMRLLASEALYSASDMKKGNMPNYIKEKIKEKAAALSNAPIFIDDTAQLSIFELRSKCRRLMQKTHGELGMIFIDYLQLMTSVSENKNGNREQEISSISRSLKALSKELSIPICALAQLSRAVETRNATGAKKPQLSDLRESGAIEQDADIVTFIYRPEYYGIPSYEDGSSTSGKANVILAKHRSGGTGEIILDFKPQFTKFENPMVITSSSGFMAANENFDSSSGSSIIVESRMNSDNDDDFAVPNQMQPDDDIPF